MCAKKFFIKPHAPFCELPLTTPFFFAARRLFNLGPIRRTDKISFSYRIARLKTNGRKLPARPQKFANKIRTFDMRTIFIIGLRVSLLNANGRNVTSSSEEKDKNAKLSSTFDATPFFHRRMRDRGGRI